MTRPLVPALSLLLVAACHPHAEPEEPEPGPISVRCAAPSARTVRDVRVLRGSTQLAPEHLARVAAQVAGRVQRLAVREGDTVTAGQVLATVETTPLRDQATAAQGGLAGARVGVASALATVARLEPLVAHGIAAQQELDDARARLAQARAAVAASQGVAAVTRTAPVIPVGSRVGSVKRRRTVPTPVRASTASATRSTCEARGAASSEPSPAVAA